MRFSSKPLLCDIFYDSSLTTLSRLHFCIMLRLLIYIIVLKFRPENAPPYDIKTSFPNKVYDDPAASLQECGLVPNATLHLLAKKVWPALIMMSRLQMECGLVPHATLHLLAKKVWPVLIMTSWLQIECGLVPNATLHLLVRKVWPVFMTLWLQMDCGLVPNATLHLHAEKVWPVLNITSWLQMECGLVPNATFYLHAKKVWPVLNMTSWLQREMRLSIVCNTSLTRQQSVTSLDVIVTPHGVLNQVRRCPSSVHPSFEDLL